MAAVRSLDGVIVGLIAGVPAGIVHGGLGSLLGHFLMLLDSDTQCWHDKLAGEVVVFSDGRTEPRPDRR